MERRPMLKEKTTGMGCRMVLFLALVLALGCSGKAALFEGERDLTILYTGNFMGQVLPQKG